MKLRAYRLCHTWQSSNKNFKKSFKENYQFYVFQNEVTSMIKVGNKWIAISAIEPPLFASLLQLQHAAIAITCHHCHHLQVAEHCTLQQNCMIVFVLVASVAMFLLLLLACTAVLSMPLLLVLTIIVHITTAIAASWLLLCFYDFLVCSCCCCDHAKVAATALAAGTYGACYAALLLPLLLLVAFALAIIISWLLLFWNDFLICYFATALFCKWCRHCSLSNYSVTVLADSITPLLLTTPWCHSVAASCHCHCCWLIVCLLFAALIVAVLLFFAVALVACDAATAWLSAHFPCAMVLLTPLLLLLVAISTIVAGCRLIVASFLWSLQALANAAASAYFAVVIWRPLAVVVIWRHLAVIATCCSCYHPYCCQ